MIKLKLSKTGEEVKIGDLLRKYKREEHSFGTVETAEVIKVSLDNLSKLIDKGVIDLVMDSDAEHKPKEEEIPNKMDDNVIFYIEKLAAKYKVSTKNMCEWLDKTNKICPKAVLDLLLQEISNHFQKKNAKVETSAYYSLRPSDGKVGKVSNIHGYIPLFNNAEDAEKARIILRKQLEFMYGK